MLTTTTNPITSTTRDTPTAMITVVMLMPPSSPVAEGASKEGNSVVDADADVAVGGLTAPVVDGGAVAAVAAKVLRWVVAHVMVDEAPSKPTKVTPSVLHCPEEGSLNMHW